MKRNPFIFPFYIVLLVFISQSLLAQGFQEINKLRLNLEKKFSIKLCIQDCLKNQNLTWSIDVEEANEKDYIKLHNYLLLFDEELSKYPKSFILKSKISTIVIAKSIGVEYQFNYKEVSALPDYKNGLLVFNFIRGDYNKIYQRHSIHHELSHMFEGLFKHHSYWKNSDWIKLNSEPYYATSGWYSQKSPYVGILNHPDKGFVNRYSESSQHEDTAEIFAILFMQEEYKKVKQWFKQDELLKNKFEYMKAFLNKYDSSFDAGFWENLNEQKSKL